MNGTIFTDFTLASLPILLLIATGFLTRRLLVQDSAVWTALDRINFRILIPALIISTIAQTNIHAVSGLRLGAAIVLVLLTLTLILVFLCRLLVPAVVDYPAYSSIFQTSTRWNASIAIVVATLIFDPVAITVIAIIMVVLMPIVNVINISMMMRLPGAHDTSVAGTLVQFSRNPIILGCLIGILLSVTRAPLPEPIINSLDILGMASIGTILLSLGAGLNLSAFQRRLIPIAISSFLKLIAMPSLVLLFGSLLDIGAAFLIVITVATAMPTATNGYVVAQEMGGDAPLYASICTVQMLLSFVTVPLWLLLCLQLPLPS